MEPVTRRFPRVARPEALRVVPKRFVEKKLVVVAAVPVAFTKVRFWRVEEELTRRLLRVMRFVVSEPMAAALAKKFVVEAVVVKSVVEVALVVVLFTAVKF